MLPRNDWIAVFQLPWPVRLTTASTSAMIADAAGVRIRPSRLSSSVRLVGPSGCVTVSASCLRWVGRERLQMPAAMSVRWWLPSMRIFSTAS